MARDIRKTWRWIKMSRAVIRRDPVCLDPMGMHADQLRPSQSAHHIVGIEEREDLAFDPTNLVGLCFSCHSHLEHVGRRGADIETLVRVALNKRSSDEQNRSAGAAGEPLGGIAIARGCSSTSDAAVSEGTRSEKPAFFPGCRKMRNGIFCARMRRMKSTRCGGCETT